MLKLLQEWHPVSRVVALAGPLVIGSLLSLDLLTSVESASPKAIAIRQTSLPVETARTDQLARVRRTMSGDLVSYQAMVDRPLFTPTRHARDEAAAGSQPGRPRLMAIRPPAVPSSGIELVGTLMRDGHQLAMLNRTGKRQIETVEAGAVVEGWQVTAIHDTAIEIVSRNGAVHKRLTFPRLGNPDDVVHLFSNRDCIPGETGDFCNSMETYNTLGQDNAIGG
ncbi:MAG: hypothetical protein H6851_15655 [Geminicoccaceae bacterium]|nr:hypothetical protein [Geminicoccaceae bacterium]